jgi:glycine hydroxymethyltransferase
MIIAGGSAYPREWDYARFKEICKEVGALLFVDMAHYSGLVASKVLNSPFDYADVVTTTTHKSLRGPRAGMIFFRKEFEERINFAVFPGIQGGPHNNVIGAIAVQLKEVASDEFKQYSQQIVKNCQTLAKYLIDQKYSLATGGTDNHLILWDLRPQGITGSKVETLCDELAITLNKNAVAGDTSALVPGGVRIGTPALTSRGLVEKDFVKVGEFLHEALQLGLKIQSAAKDKTLAAFKDSLQSHKEEVHALKAKIVAFASSFPMPGLSLPATA